MAPRWPARGSGNAGGGHHHREDTTALELKVLTEDEWSLWRDLRQEALAEAPYAFASTLAQWSGVADTEERWRQRMRAVPYNVVAYLGDEPAGIVSATDLIYGEMVLLSLWVAPVARGQGVGDELIGAVLRRAEAYGASQVSLDVRNINHHAMGLYRRHGFLDAGPTPDLEPDDPPERRMVRVL